MERKVSLGRFYNCGDDAVEIVAVVNYCEGEIRDWAAYIGIGAAEDDRVCAAYVAERGCKLSAVDAAHFFPELPMDKWRR